MLRRDREPRVPYFEEGVAHFICDRAVASSFMLSGRCGVFVCVHGDETKVSYAFPEGARNDEVVAAYEVGREQTEFAQMAAERKGKRKQ